MEQPSKSTEKLLEMMRGFSNRNSLNLLKSIAFLYTNKNQSKNIMGKNNSFTRATKKYKILRESLAMFSVLV